MVGKEKTETRYSGKARKHRDFTRFMQKKVIAFLRFYYYNGIQILKLANRGCNSET